MVCQLLVVVRYATKLTITQGLTPNTVYSELQMVYKDYRELVRRLGNRPKLHVVRRTFAQCIFFISTLAKS